VGKEKIGDMTQKLEEKSKDETIRFKDLERIIDQINEQRKIQTDKEHGKLFLIN